MYLFNPYTSLYFVSFLCKSTISDKCKIMSSEAELGLVGEAVNLSEEQLISLVKEHNSISGQLSCPICLQLFNTPSRTK